MLEFVCRFGVEVRRYIFPSLVKGTFTSRKGMLVEECTGEFDGGVNVAKMVDENF